MTNDVGWGKIETNTIYNMDCLEGMKLIPNNTIDLIITDPPYGINYQSSRRIEEERFNTITQDDVINTTFLNDCYRILKDNTALYVFTRWDVYPEWKQAIEQEGFTIKNLIIWDRMIHGLGDLTGSYAPRHDFIIFATKGRHILKNGRPIDILRFQRPNIDKMVHPTEKPTQLIKELIYNSSDRNEVILDCFAGSGSTLLASKQLNRNFIGFEIDKGYCDIIKKRLEQTNLLDVLNNG